jgi:hypothetical protein
MKNIYTIPVLTVTILMSIIMNGCSGTSPESFWRDRVTGDVKNIKRDDTWLAANKNPADVLRYE